MRILNRFAFFWAFVILLFHVEAAFAVKMKGKVYDIVTNEPLDNVSVYNTFTQKYFITDSSGLFAIDVEHGHLIEFKKIGYKIVRIRISGHEQLPYYSLGMTVGPYELDEVEIRGRSYKTDSIIDRETYKWAIEHYTLDGFSVLQHPFDALSKRNRQIWAFQKRFEYFEQQKFIDYVFNDHLIMKLTDIDSSEIEVFKRVYRPEYFQIKAWTEYEFYEYIKESGIMFLKRRGRKH